MRLTRRSLLTSVAATALAKTTGLPKLNHFYATVDSATYAAIGGSSFLHQQFAPFERRTTVRNDSTYSGLYFYGIETYFEFFEENTGDRKPGDAGVALGLESPGASEHLREAWEKIQSSRTTVVTRQLNGQPLEWFRMTSFEETRAQSIVEGLRLFSMEYMPGFVSAWQPPAAPLITQQAILSAYCAKLDLLAVRRSSMLDNVKRLVIAAPEPGVRLRSRQLQAAGWNVKPRGRGIDCTGPNAKIEFRFADRPLGVREIEFSLKRNVPGTVRQLGSSTLETAGRRAIWRLGA